MTRFQVVALVLAAGIVAGAALWRSSVEDAALSRVGACVVAEAHAQGYTGNPYSEQAWLLFSGDCN